MSVVPAILTLPVLLSFPASMVIESIQNPSPTITVFNIESEDEESQNNFDIVKNTLNQQTGDWVILMSYDELGYPRIFLQKGKELVFTEGEVAQAVEALFFSRGLIGEPTNSWFEFQKGEESFLLRVEAPARTNVFGGFGQGF